MKSGVYLHACLRFSRSHVHVRAHPTESLRIMLHIFRHSREGAAQRKWCAEQGAVGKSGVHQDNALRPSSISLKSKLFETRRDTFSQNGVDWPATKGSRPEPLSRENTGLLSRVKASQSTMLHEQSSAVHVAECIPRPHVHDSHSATDAELRRRVCV